MSVLTKDLVTTRSEAGTLTAEEVTAFVQETAMIAETAAPLLVTVIKSAIATIVIATATEVVNMQENEVTAMIAETAASLVIVSEITITLAVTAIGYIDSFKHIIFLFPLKVNNQL